MESIKKSGQRQPIMVVGKMVIDGWHRLHACVLAGVEPDFEELTLTKEQIADMVIGNHQGRRHMTPGERATAVVATRLACGAKLPRGGRPEKTVSNDTVLTRQSVAHEAGVSEPTAQRAIAEAKDGAPDRAKGIKDRATAAGGRSKRKRQEQLDGATAKRDAKEREDILAEELDEARAFIVTLKARLGDVDLATMPKPRCRP